MAGLVLGLEQAPSAIYPHGKDQDGYTDQEHAGGCFGQDLRHIHLS